MSGFQATIPSAMETSVERARVRPEDRESQSVLFPLSDFSRRPPTPRDVCARIRLNWLAAVKLHESGWLSFDPAASAQLNPAQEAELIFLGSLVAAGCDESLLRQLLAGLQKPYAYQVDRLSYNWAARSWQLRPTDADLRSTFETWVDDLVDTNQIATLESLRHCVNAAIADLRQVSYW